MWVRNFYNIYKRGAFKDITLSWSSQVFQKFSIKGIDKITNLWYNEIRNHTKGVKSVLLLKSDVFFKITSNFSEELICFKRLVSSSFVEK